MFDYTKRKNRKMRADEALVISCAGGIDAIARAITFSLANPDYIIPLLIAYNLFIDTAPVVIRETVYNAGRLKEKFQKSKPTR